MLCLMFTPNTNERVRAHRYIIINVVFHGRRNALRYFHNIIIFIICIMVE